ncbi:glycosyltransferase family 39 protein [Rhodococcus phenolicus]|uniref:glycosyltransferase family 39 protein n=1 Tax=Rhodococcus phenolicus TaxID=263849 RepID=UPI00082AF077|nr:glycosyltransferase family 39 protein [Rhodococcus phenolicus]
MRAWPVPVVVGIGTALIGTAFSWVPSLWWDEAATISAANRPLGELADVLAEWDAVHGLYYLVMHGWFQLVGISEFTARLPGALILGVGGAAVAAVAQTLAGTRAAVAAGVVFAVLPRVTWAATEARSYPFVIAGVAVLSWLLVVALRARTTPKLILWWTLYALVAALATVMFLYSVTVLAAHAVTVWAAPARDGRRWRARSGFVLAAAVASVISASFAALAIAQSKQVSWIPPIDRTVVNVVLVEQWFPQAPWLAAMCGVLVAAGVATRRALSPGERTLLWLAVPGFAVPMILLLAYSLFFRNVYLDRYLSFTAPAAALLVGWAVARIARRWWAVVAVLTATAVAAAPAYAQQRQPFGKAGGMDHSAVADRLIEVSQPGDCVAFEPTISWQPTSPRSIADARPDAFAGLVDIGLDRTAVERDLLWSTDVPPDVLARRAAGCTRLWVIADGERDHEWSLLHPNNVSWRFAPYRFTDTETFRALAAAGFEITGRERTHRMQIVRLEPADQTQ